MALRLFSCLVLGALTIGGADVQARSLERATIRLSCPSGVPDLCRALVQALSGAAAGGPVVTRVGQGDEAPAREGDLGVALHLEARTANALSARLRWQAAGAPPRDGPLVRLDVLDAPLAAARFDRFARALLRASPGIVPALRRTPAR